MYVRVFTGRGLPGTGEDRRRHFETVRALIRRQPGFVSFEMLEDGDDWMVIARWRTREDADRWGVSPAFREEVRARLLPLLRDPPLVSTYRVVVPEEGREE